jgi:hypothetical protein
MLQRTSPFRQLAREWTFLAIRGLLRRFHPQIAGTRPESLFRWLGFFERPEPAEIIANYLRGYVLFGRNTRYGEWFHWCKRADGAARSSMATFHMPCSFVFMK